MPITIKIDRLRIPPGVSLPPSVSLFYKKYYDENYELVATDIDIDENGYVLDSPKPVMSIDPGERYTMMAINESCGYEYKQSLILQAYCPVGYDLAPDGSYCFYEEVTEATAPDFAEVTVAKQYNSYNSCGSWIYEPGYNVNGTGTSELIPLENLFWRNGDDPTGCIPSIMYTGPLNRAGLWSTTSTNDQKVGFPVCLELPESKWFYFGIGCDNLGIVNLDGVNIITQDPAALDAQYGLSSGVSAFVIWHIYPIFIEAGSHILELIGFNTFGPAAMGCEVYDNTAEEIAAATSYADLNLIFSSKDYIGMPVVLGTDGVGFSCPADYSLRACTSPYECVKIVKTNVLISGS